MSSKLAFTLPDFFCQYEKASCPAYHLEFPFEIWPYLEGTAGIWGAVGAAGCCADDVTGLAGIGGRARFDNGAFLPGTARRSATVLPL
jgi:hypothetical protein